MPPEVKFHTERHRAGNNSDADDALLNELTILSKENRELREKIVDLESKISTKNPKLSISITPPTINEEFDSHVNISMPCSLSIDDVESHLLEYITPEDIAKYNSSLPDQVSLDKFNSECDRVYKIRKYSTPLVIDVGNSGSAKASNIFIDIEFPDGVFIYENNSKFDTPEKIIPIDPIKVAQRQYDKKMAERHTQDSALSSLQSRIRFGAGNNFESATALIAHNFNMPPIRSINQSWWTRIDGNKITIKINNLLHTRRMTFDDEYMITPLRSGKHTISVSVICEEYGSAETQFIEIEI